MTTAFMLLTLLLVAPALAALLATCIRAARRKPWRPMLFLSAAFFGGTLLSLLVADLTAPTQLDAPAEMTADEAQMHEQFIAADHAVRTAMTLATAHARDLMCACNARAHQIAAQAVARARAGQLALITFGLPGRPARLQIVAAAQAEERAAHNREP